MELPALKKNYVYSLWLVLFLLFPWDNNVGDNTCALRTCIFPLYDDDENLQEYNTVRLRNTVRLGNTVIGYGILIG